MVPHTLRPFSKYMHDMCYCSVLAVRKNWMLYHSALGCEEGLYLSTGMFFDIETEELQYTFRASSYFAIGAITFLTRHMGRGGS